jgi:hypothetical protein
VSTTHPSYIQDTPHLRTLLTGVTLPDTFTLFTGDVEDLYSNIPHREGILLTKLALEKRDSLQGSPLTPHQINLTGRLLDLQLNHNNFCFLEKEYTQTHSCAMGKAWAPSYANIYMANWEEKIKQTKPEKQPIFWKRFLDDIMGIYPGDIRETEQFLAGLNSIDPNIRLTWNIQPREVNFLDLTIYIEDGKIEHKIFHKPTDTQQYIRWNSNHPISTKRAVSYQLFLRNLNNCSKPQQQKKENLNTRAVLLRRGFPKRILNFQMKKATNFFHTQKLKKVIENERIKVIGDNQPFLIITHHPHIGQLPSKIHQLHQEITKDLTLNPLFKEDNIRLWKPPRVAWKRPKNIRDILVRAHSTRPK